MKITVVGAGYVGLSLGTLLSEKNDIYILDIIPEKIDMINKRISPIKDDKIEEFFNTKKLNLKGTLDYKEAFKDSKYIIISTPTNFDPITNNFDTKSIEDILQKIKSMNITPTIIIKSTVPIGYTENIKKKYNMNNIIFSPEFLREGKALYDNLYPSRIIIGEKSEKAKEFANILSESAIKKDIPIKYMNSTEAETVKLFANSYLALRVAYFNELDTFSIKNNLDAKDIIDGVCLDPRIGDFYNNPSFGYGGYCLPKDTKQLLSNFNNTPQNLISAIVDANATRKRFIAEQIIKMNPKVVGVYRLIMKKDSNNYRSSSIIDIINILKEYEMNTMIYEPTLESDSFMDFKVIHDLNKFKEESSIILTNRKDKDLEDVKQKIYTRDIFYRD